MKNMPNIDIPKDYQKVGLEIFSKFNCSRISCTQKKAILGTCDGRTTIFDFKEVNGGIKVENSMVSKHQKKLDSGRIPIHGQVNSVDLGVFNY
jgi:hypothetical protein